MARQIVDVSERNKTRLSETVQLILLLFLFYLNLFLRHVTHHNDTQQNNKKCDTRHDIQHNYTRNCYADCPSV